MNVLRIPELDAYRIGWRSRYSLSVHRPWQCEISYGHPCSCDAVRAFSAEAARRRMARRHNRAAAAGRCANRSLRIYPRRLRTGGQP